MHNIHELEQRWLKYKIKFYLPYVITIIFSLVLLLFLFFIIDSKTEIKTIKEQEHIASKTVLDKETKILKDNNKTRTKDIKEIEELTQVKPVIDQTPSKEESVEQHSYLSEKNIDQKIVLTPSLDFMKKLRTDSVNSYNIDDSQEYQPKYVQQPKEQNYKALEDTQDTVEAPVQNDMQEPKKPQINISKKETQNDIQDVIKRFKKNNNPALSLFIAKKYYKLGDYQQAYNYALLTNQINNDIEQSWIIFAKSLVKLDKKDKAIKTLTKYVKHSDSSNAKVLLDDIKSGKFR
jgi:tetratricopeptide (TPR) repeat protein